MWRLIQNERTKERHARSALCKDSGELPEPALLERREEFPQREDVDSVLGALGAITEIHDQPPFHASQPRLVLADRLDVFVELVLISLPERLAFHSHGAVTDR
jgi:hypothetical protein